MNTRRQQLSSSLGNQAEPNIIPYPFPPALSPRARVLERGLPVSAALAETSGASRLSRAQVPGWVWQPLDPPRGQEIRITPGSGICTRVLAPAGAWARQPPRGIRSQEMGLLQTIRKDSHMHLTSSRFGRRKEIFTNRWEKRWETFPSVWKLSVAFVKSGDGVCLLFRAFENKRSLLTTAWNITWAWCIFEEWMNICMNQWRLQR